MLIRKRHLGCLMLAVATLFVADNAVAQIRFDKNLLKNNDSWFRSEAAQTIADSVIQYQSPQGGWPKSINLAMPPRTPDDVPPPGGGRANSFDNDATTVPMQFLARISHVTREARHRDAFLRGLDYVLAAQYPNGGWPQFWPLRKGYYSHITYNDGAMIRVMEVIRDVAQGEAPYDFVDKERRGKAAKAMARGIDCILKTQIQQDGKLTAWCAQHDAETLAPAWARAYEPPSLSCSESVGIVRFLLKLEEPTDDVAAAIEGAVEWLRKVQMKGYRTEEVMNDDGRRERMLIVDPNAPPLWARFYELKTNRPLYLDRNSVFHYDYSEISYERRSGYTYHGTWAASVLEKYYPRWREKNRRGGLEIRRSVIVEGDSDRDWTQARTAIVPGEHRSFALTTMSRTEKVGAHGYHDVFAVFGDRDADKWTQPTAIESLRRTRQDDGYEVVAGDLCPIWHPQTEKVLITGKTFNFADGKKENFLREQVSYCVFDPASRESGPLHTMKLPQQDHAGHPIIAPNAGCHQQVVLDDGTVLLPVRYQRSKSKRNYVSIVARCRFDGETLEYIDHGTEHSIPTNRGLYEPSVTAYDGAFFLTTRADDGAWVARSSDGTHYSDHVPWKFDNGQDLGSYNTQQHWVTLGKRLYLVYTRRGANNDHIMRHRAPLFIAEVDPERLVVLKNTEQVVVPENHATLGNSGVCRISDGESWITVAEGRVTQSKRKGDNNRVILAKLRLAD